MQSFDKTLDGGHDELDAIFGIPNFEFRDLKDVFEIFLADGTNLKTFLIVIIVSTVLPALISQKLCLFEIVCTARAPETEMLKARIDLMPLKQQAQKPRVESSNLFTSLTTRCNKL